MVPAYPSEKRYEAYHADSVVNQSQAARYSDLAIRRKSIISPIRPFPISQLLDDNNDSKITDINATKSNPNLPQLD